MILLEIVVYEWEDCDFNCIKEICFVFVYEFIFFDVCKGVIGLFMFEVVWKVICEWEVNFVFFYFLYDCFIGFDISFNSIVNYYLVFLIELFIYLGFLLVGCYFVVCFVFDL